MKIINDIKTVDVIGLDEVTPSHVIVGSFGGRPVILTQEKFHNGAFKWRCLDGGFTFGNGFDSRDVDSTNFHSVLLYRITQFPEDEIQAFLDWRGAFKWLLDNC